MSGYSRWMERNFIGGTFPPQHQAVATITGTGSVGQVLTATTGNWFYAPSSYAYQWVRAPATNIGTNTSTYTLVAGDSGFAVWCVVSAVNAAGTTLGPPSNQIRCA
jgi:hypothetical protein